MINKFEFIVFLLFTIYILLKSIAYALYEIKKNGNKFGGICVILVALLSTVTSNFVVLVI